MSIFFSHDELVTGLGEEYHRGEVLFSSHPIRSVCGQQDLSPSVLTSIKWLAFVSFLRSKFTTHPHPPTFCTLLQEASYQASLALKGWELSSSFLRAEYLHQLFGILYTDFTLFPIQLLFDNFKISPLDTDSSRFLIFFNLH